MASSPNCENCVNNCRNDPHAPSSDKPCHCPGGTTSTGEQLPDYYVSCGVHPVPNNFKTCNKIVIGKDGKKECCTDCDPPKKLYSSPWSWFWV